MSFICGLSQWRIIKRFRW